MSEFTHGFNMGFAGGMFNRMFGGCNPCCGFNPTPVFYSPVMNFNSFTRYFTPMPEISLPVIDTNFSAPSFQASFQAPVFNFNTNFTMSSFKMPAMQMPDFNNFAFNFPFVNTNIDTFTSSKKASSVKVDSNSNSNSSSSKAKHWTAMTDAELKAVYGNYTRSATKKYNGTAEQLNKFLKGKLSGKGQAFIDAQNKYGISASVLAAICMNESYNGSSRLAKTKNNVGGVRVAGSSTFRSFTSIEECIDYMGGLLKRNYVDKNLTCLYQINAKYCPASDTTDRTGNNSNWAKAVDKFAGQIEKSLA